MRQDFRGDAGGAAVYCSNVTYSLLDQIDVIYFKTAGYFLDV